MTTTSNEKFSSSLQPLTLRKLRLLAAASDSTLSDLLEQGAQFVIEQHRLGGSASSELLSVLERAGR